MKKLKILFLLVLTPFLVSCTKVISNPDVQTLNQKAVELMNSGDVKGAIARLESINDLNPDFPQTHYNLGVAYYKNQDYEKAITALKQAVDLDKNLADAYYTIGLSYQELAGREAEQLDKPENKTLSKKEILTQITDNLKNSKDFYTQYINMITGSEEKERIGTEIQNIDSDIKKFEEKLNSGSQKNL